MTYDQSQLIDTTTSKDELRCTFKVDRDKVTVFNTFIDEMGTWWPSIYTWGQDSFAGIMIERSIGGRITEMSTDGNQFDFGQVTTWEPPAKFDFLWKISPTRVPEPNPEKASVVMLRFNTIAESRTEVILTHRDFSNHGEGNMVYLTGMASKEGWEWILLQFIEHLLSKRS